MQKIYYNGREVRDAHGRFTSYWKSIKWFCKRVMIGTAILLTALGLYVGGQVNVKLPELIPVVEAKDKFSEFPLLVKICKAESGNRQFEKSGRVLRGRVNPSDIGFCQIHEPIWNDKARELGYDIYTEQGNKDMAIYIFLTEGESPWNSSRGGKNGWGK